MKVGRKPEYPEKTPRDELLKMTHTKALRFKPQARLEPAQQHWWQARKADVLSVAPRVAPIVMVVMVLVMVVATAVMVVVMVVVMVIFRLALNLLQSIAVHY